MDSSQLLLPKMLQYGSIKPHGMPSRFKRWEITPMTNQQSYGYNDVIRFQLQTTDYIDPYKTYIEVRVEVEDADYLPSNYMTTINNTNAPASLVNVQQLDLLPIIVLDGPATSIISESILYSNSKEIERVQEYDQLGQILSDIGFPGAHRPGNGYCGYQFDRLYNNNSQSVDIPAIKSNPQPQAANATTCLQRQFVNPLGLCGTPFGVGNLSTVSYATIAGIAALFPRDSVTGDNEINPYAASINIRNCYNYARELVLNDGMFGVDHQYTQNGVPYDANNVTGTSMAATNTNSYKADVAGDYGFSTACNQKRVLFNRASSINTFAYLAPNITCAKWRNGQPITDYKRGGVSRASTVAATNLAYEWRDSMTSRTFYIPLLSGVMGQLIPQDAWKLIPGKGCGQLMFEFRLNRYAFFLSGHQNNTLSVAVKDSANVVTQADLYALKYSVTKMSMHFDLWNFEQGVNEAVDAQLNGPGIVLCSQQFTMANCYQIANTPSAKGNWRINNSIMSLRTVYFWYLLNDYTTWNYCRKQYRISHNLKSVQLKMGNEYHPQVAIQGHAGNIFDDPSNSLGNVTQFLTELYRTHGDFFNTQRHMNIVPENFVVNDRCYNITSISATTAQLALMHEQRLQGKALYSISLDSDPFDSTVLSGYNTSEVKPIELVIDVASGLGDQTRNSTMYIMLHHDMLVSFTGEGITTAGSN